MVTAHKHTSRAGVVRENSSILLVLSYYPCSRAFQMTAAVLVVSNCDPLLLQLPWQAMALPGHQQVAAVSPTSCDLQQSWRPACLTMGGEFCSNHPQNLMNLQGQLLVLHHTTRPYHPLTTRTHCDWSACCTRTQTDAPLHSVLQSHNFVCP